MEDVEKSNKNLVWWKKREAAHTVRKMEPWWPQIYNIFTMVSIPPSTQTLLQRTWNMVQIHTTTKPCTKAHWIPNKHKVKISTPLPLSSLQNKTHKRHPHTFTDRSNQNGHLFRAISNSPGISKRRRQTGVKTAHRLQENRTPTQMASFTPYL